jgi:hypothetical protein
MSVGRAASHLLPPTMRPVIMIESDAAVGSFASTRQCSAADDMCVHRPDQMGGPSALKLFPGVGGCWAET